MSVSTPRGLDPAARSGYADHPPRVGFFTDTSVCIGCKACEVACKEWNAVPEDGIALTGMSYDNTVGLGASTWRHVAFIEQPVTAVAPSSPGPSSAFEGVRWLLASDVCKHCTESACLDVCPTGALFRTEFGTVVVQDDVCNGCGYCVGACPPESIQFGPLDELRERAALRVQDLRAAGQDQAQLYLDNPDDGIGGGGDTAVPGWHEAHREMPYLFAGSAPWALRPRWRPSGCCCGAWATSPKPYETGRPGRLLRAAEVLTVGGLAGAVLGRRNRVVSALAGMSLLTASALTRFGVFEAGLATVGDPKYTIVLQRRRRDRRGMN